MKFSKINFYQTHTNKEFEWNIRCVDYKRFVNKQNTNKSSVMAKKKAEFFLFIFQNISLPHNNKTNEWEWISNK